jgi:carboxyl-terminal processing protease
VENILNLIRRKSLIIFLSIIIIISLRYEVLAQDYNSFSKFEEIYYLIKNYYVEDTETDELINGAINGMIETLDPFSSYLLPDEYDDMKLEFDGHFSGIGIVITIRNEELTIVSPIKDTPGERIGLESGDIIKDIDGISTKDMSIDKAVSLMRGDEGTEVVLTIKREKEDEPLEFTIIRDDIEIPYVESEMQTDEIGYIIISQFAKDVGIKVEKTIKELISQGSKALILDLRNNPGGLLNEAIKVASNFIDNGIVVSVGQRDGSKKNFYTDNRINAVDLPMVVLINGGSASASEIVSGAIQDLERGKLIGTKSFGKGTVQSVIPLQDGSALRLTTARYYTPSGRFIHDKGIEPNIEIDINKECNSDIQLEEAIDYLETQLLLYDININDK